MEKYMLELLGTYLQVNNIHYVVNEDHGDYWMSIDIRDRNGFIDDLCIVFQSEFNEHGLATGEFVYKVQNDWTGTIYKSTNTVDTCEFITDHIEQVIVDFYSE